MVYPDFGNKSSTNLFESLKMVWSYVYLLFSRKLWWKTSYGYASASKQINIQTNSNAKCNVVWLRIFQFHARILNKKAIESPYGKIIRNIKRIWAYPLFHVDILTIVDLFCILFQLEDNIPRNNDVNNVTHRLKNLSTKSDGPDTDHCSNSKSRLQMRAPPPLDTLPSTNISEPSYSGSSILSPCSSNQGGSGVERGPSSNSWLANSNRLDSLLNHKHLTMCINDPSQFDDDLPSLLAKQVN